MGIFLLLHSNMFYVDHKVNNILLLYMLLVWWGVRSDRWLCWLTCRGLFFRSQSSQLVVDSVCAVREQVLILYAAGQLPIYMGLSMMETMVKQTWVKKAFCHTKMPFFPPL